ncbi:MAG: hypothetical protein E4H31_01450, partial [Dehalococcoidia bacterium]
MKTADIISTAFGNLKRRKARTILTAGGIAIGIASLTLIVSLATGAQNYITAQANAFLAPNTILVVSEKHGGFMESMTGLSVGQPPQEVNSEITNISGMMMPPRSLRPEQVIALKSLPDILAVYPQVFVSANAVGLQG